MLTQEIFLILNQRLFKHLTNIIAMMLHIIL